MDLPLNNSYWCQYFSPLHCIGELDFCPVGRIGLQGGRPWSDGSGNSNALIILHKDEGERVRRGTGVSLLLEI